jgi:hypothetical protein
MDRHDNDDDDKEDEDVGLTLTLALHSGVVAIFVVTITTESSGIVATGRSGPKTVKGAVDDVSIEWMVFDASTVVAWAGRCHRARRPRTATVAAPDAVEVTVLYFIGAGVNCRSRGSSRRFMDRPRRG